MDITLARYTVTDEIADLAAELIALINERNHHVDMGRHENEDAIYDFAFTIVSKDGLKTDALTERFDFSDRHILDILAEYTAQL